MDSLNQSSMQPGEKGTLQQFGRYRIDRELGRGGMGTVFLAYDPNFDRQVAIKLLPAGFLQDASFRVRFDREAKMIARLEHPAIVPVYDYGEDQGCPYLVMRYMGGGTLKERLAHGALPAGEINAILQRICSALDKAHARGVVHRDLKPGNILFDEDSNAYLADFGIARLTETSQTFTVLGTPQYLTPEQANGQPVDARTDVYQMGVVLFEMLTGRIPFDADTPVGLIFQHVTAPIPSVRALNHQLPPSADAVLSKAMAKLPDARYSTAGALAAAAASEFLAAPPGDHTLYTPPAGLTAAGAFGAGPRAESALRQSRPARPTVPPFAPPPAARGADRPVVQAAKEAVKPARRLNRWWLLVPAGLAVLALAGVLTVTLANRIREEQTQGMTPAVDPERPVLVLLPSAETADALPAPLCPDPQPLWVTDLELRQPTLAVEPLPRVPFRDPALGSCVVRVTDRQADLTPYDESLGLKNEYSRVQSFNADESALLVFGTAYEWYLYDARSLQLRGRLPLGQEPRWDADDPDLIVYNEENRLLTFDVSSGETHLLHDFGADFPGQSLAAVWTREEGRPSNDTRYWGLMAEDEEWLPVAFVVYDRTTDRATVRDVRGLPGIEDDVDHVTMSPLGTYFLASFDRACAPRRLGDDAHPCGLMVYDRDLTRGRGLLRIIGHYDTVLDAQGREVIVYQDIDADTISMLDLETGAATPLWPIDFSKTPLGLHFSGLAVGRPGWALVSTYSGGYPVSVTWMDDQVFAIELRAGGRLVRLAHTYSRVDPDHPEEHDYWAEPQASVNQDFTRILFTSNWGRSGTEEVDLFLVELPADWSDRPLPSLTPTSTSSATRAPVPTKTRPATPEPRSTPTRISYGTTTPGTREASPSPSETAAAQPRTSTPTPTATGGSVVPLPTNTPLPTRTDTPRPLPTDTPLPTRTDTPRPPPTDTPIPPPTDTPIPEPTATPIPPRPPTPTP